MLKKLTICLFLFSLNRISFSQSNNPEYISLESEIGRGMQKIINAYYKNCEDVKLTIPIKAADGSILKIRATFKYKEYGIYLRDGWLDARFDKGLLHCIYTHEGRWKCVLNRIIPLVSKEEYLKMAARGRLFHKEYLMQNKSFVKALQEIENYPKEYDVKNSLAMVTRIEDSYRAAIVDTRQYVHEIPSPSLQSVYDGEKEVCYYKNISNHPVVIKIIASIIDGSPHYGNVSVILQPGDVIRGCFRFNKEYDPEGDMDQIIGDPGIIADHRNGKPEKTNSNVTSSDAGKKIEVSASSYNGTITDINVKKGDKITISVTGIIAVTEYLNHQSPEGIEVFNNYSRVDGFPFGCLLVRIGNNSKWQATKSSLAFTATEAGDLEFLINDIDPSDNRGAFTVEVKITK